MNTSRNVRIIRYDNGTIEDREDFVVPESPFSIILNGRDFVTLLCTPVSLEYLAIGFLLSEGIIKNVSEIIRLAVDEAKTAAVVETANKDSLAEKIYGKRTMTTGCGRGSVFYNAIDAVTVKKAGSTLRLGTQDIIRLMKEFNRRSELFIQTGGVHSAALSDGKEILLFHEDIGRHNAVDKLIGEAASREFDIKDNAIITSGRISSEVVIKCAKQQIPVIISRSAPTELALRMAEQAGITVVGFARGLKFNVYCHYERISL